MCLGEVARVVALTAAGSALVRTARGEAAISLLPLDAPVAAGDWVLVHSGFALAVLTEDEAFATFAARTAAQEGQR